MKVKAIIFDFDNTLVRSNINFPLMKITMARITKDYGIDFGEENEIPNKYTAGNIIDEAKKYDEKNKTNLVSILWGLVEDFERKGMENLTIEKEVFTILETLQNQGVILSLLTNNAKKPTLEVLEQYNLKKFFKVIIAREDVKQMKPDSEGIELILKKLRLSPNYTIFVGDSWVDGKAANSANIRFVLYREEPLDQKKYGISIWKFINQIADLLDIVS